MSTQNAQKRAKSLRQAQIDEERRLWKQKMAEEEEVLLKQIEEADRRELEEAERRQQEIRAQLDASQKQESQLAGVEATEVADGVITNPGNGSGGATESVEVGDDDQAMDVKEDDLPKWRWDTLPNNERCPACEAENVKCHVDWKPNLLWRRALEMGIMVTRPPPGTACRRCQDQKLLCLLPATRNLMLAGQLNAKAEMEATKSKDLRPAKRARTSDAGTETNDQSRVLFELILQHLESLTDRVSDLEGHILKKARLLEGDH